MQLLSTNLPQNGTDTGGLLGYLIRDIRYEIKAATQRKCFYCKKTNASIQCHKCQKYFHLICGYTNECLFQFIDYFYSYCDSCIELDDYQKMCKKNIGAKEYARCHICTRRLCNYSPLRWIYAPCCGKGFVHSICLQKYALNAGYYLRCIWCKNDKFRELVKLQGVFVPDRDAIWEREKDAYKDLHRGHQSCNMVVCNCPRGRNYSSTPRWSLILCKLCGSFGAHNPNCIPGKENSKSKVDSFTCDACSSVEQNLSLTNRNLSLEEDNLNYLSHSLIVQKDSSKIITQKPLQEIEPSKDNNFVELEMYEFENKLKCTGIVRVRIDLNEERFRGKSLEDIQKSTNLIKDSDIIHRSTVIPILEEIHRIISFYTQQI